MNTDKIILKNIKDHEELKEQLEKNSKTIESSITTLRKKDKLTSKEEKELTSLLKKRISINKAITTVENKINKLTKALEESGRQTQGSTQALSQNTKEQHKNEQAIKQATKNLNKFNKEAAKTAKIKAPSKSGAGNDEGFFPKLTGLSSGSLGSVAAGGAGVAALGAIGVPFLAASAIVGSSALFISKLNTMVEEASKDQSLAEQNNITVDQLNSIKKIASLSGLTTENITDLIEELSNKIGEGDNKAFNKILKETGLNKDYILGLSNYDAFREILQKLIKMENAQKATSLGNDLFAGEATKAIYALRNNQKSVDKAFKLESKNTSYKGLSKINSLKNNKLTELDIYIKKQLASVAPKEETNIKKNNLHINKNYYQQAEQDNKQEKLLNELNNKQEEQNNQQAETIKLQAEQIKQQAEQNNQQTQQTNKMIALFSVMVNNLNAIKDEQRRIREKTEEEKTNNTRFYNESI